MNTISIELGNGNAQVIFGSDSVEITIEMFQKLRAENPDNVYTLDLNKE